MSATIVTFGLVIDIFWNSLAYVRKNTSSLIHIVHSDAVLMICGTKPCEQRDRISGVPFIVIVLVEGSELE